ncbi:SWAP/Surp [Macleaya cordata]|uniref:SWAP/Surp n=1 Tax=Macleaya cordata TaxID=56857 RepID=A0A200QH04_MACCD|nr:SWAP/Surp [Macleaya cordata]
MDLEVVGRHALFFDDDASSAFVNSQEALVEWNSLLIDRYDVRHLLQTPPPPLKRRRHPPPSESEIDYERFLDLPPPESEYNPDESSIPESNNGAEQAAGGTYNAVAFSYGNSDVSADQRNSNAGVGYSGFLPPFPVPESLLQNLPPTEKLHQIMARTAVFVKKHGGQSEIVLRVKQGDNPTFGFLMPDHQLHAYFRFLVDHPEVLKSDMDSKLQDEDKKIDNEQNQTADVSGGALSLLGSVYGSGEDEDGSLQVANESNEKNSGCSPIASDSTHSHESERAEASLNLTLKDDEAPKHPLPSAKEKPPSSKRIHSVTAAPGGKARGKKTEGGVSGSSSTSVNKPEVSTLPGRSKFETLILEPPSDLKRTMDKIVEFILRNGKEFEAILIEQDAKNGRFPFLLSSNQYHPYYLKVLQEAQESKQTGKSSTSQKMDTIAHAGGKKAALSKENDIVYVGHDLPYDSEKKEKFKMVIGGPKKDTQDPPSKAAQQQFGVTVDAAAAAAILQAATRGLRNPKLDILPKKSLDDSSPSISGEGRPKNDAQGPPPKPSQQQFGVTVDAAEAAAILQAATRGPRNPKLDILPKKALDNSSPSLSNEGGPGSSFGSLSFSSRARSSTPKPVSDLGEPSLSRPDHFSRSVVQSGKDGNKTSCGSVAKAIAKTAAVAAATEADSSEACLTREQKQKAERLKRAKMFAAMIKGGAAPHLDAPSSCLSAEPPDSVHSGLLGSGHKASSVDGPAQSPDSANFLGAEIKEFLSREREGSSVPADIDTSDKMDKAKNKESNDDYKEKRSRKKHHSRSRRLEEDDDDEGEREHRHSRKKHRSSHHSSHRDRDEHNHRKRHSSSKDTESRHRHKHHSSSEDKHWHRRRSDRHRRGSHSDRKVESEDDEISTKLSDHSNSIRIDDSAKRDATLDLLDDHPERSSPLVADSHPSENTEIPDDLRAKVRAMLATL